MPLKTVINMRRGETLFANQEAFTNSVLFGLVRAGEI